jgi:type II secretory pathway component GspD/PulD (secretin)
LIFLIFLICGCGDFVSSKNAGTESSRILKELRNIEPPQDSNIVAPLFVTAPPKIIKQIVGGKTEYKLFYYCQYHIASELEKIVQAQFASTLFDAKGQSIRVTDYTVSSNDSTNQIIARCPDINDVKAVFYFMQAADVPPIQVRIDCLISEIYADKTLDWETSLEMDNLLGENIWAGPSGRSFSSGVDTLVTEPTMPAFPGGSLRELSRAKMGLKIGYLSRSNNFLSMVDILESQGYLKILMNPSLEVVNGKTAKVMSSQKVPIARTYLLNSNSDIYESKQEYEDVIDSLEITPHVFANGIGLETSIVIGSKLTPEGIKQVPIVTKKMITNKENRIMPGDSLIIGGMRKTEKRDVLRGIPILKDIPLIGMLFSGRDFEERAVETIFILTPSISSGGISQQKMIDRVSKMRGENKPEKVEK